MLLDGRGAIISPDLSHLLSFLLVEFLREIQARNFTQMEAKIALL